MDTKAEYYVHRFFTKDEAVVSRIVAGECILVPIKRKSADVTSIYTLNDVGSRIWELIDGQRTVTDISSLIVEEYEVTLEDARKDVVQFVIQLETLGAVTGT